MVYGFARQSDGHVRIYSEEGHGTTVKLYLPRHRGSVRRETERDAEVAVANTTMAGKTVLVVEDEAVVRLLVVEVLEEMGYVPLEAVDAAIGLRVLQTASQVELLITDVGLPGGMNGRQLADAARQIRPELKVLFITGYAQNAALGNGLLEPGMAMLSKPFPLDVLRAKIGSIMARAVKTRERLFTELKAKLELHTEEQHLFPVLRRNPETKGLVAEARRARGPAEE
jgi:CheY-like chemotaxis protein